MQTDIRSIPLNSFAIIGMPGPLTNWLHVLVKSIYQELNQCDFQNVTLDDDLSTQEFLANSTSENRLIVSHFPRTALIERLHTEKIPILIAIQSPHSCVRHQSHANKLTFLDAARLITQSLSLISNIIRTGPYLFLHEGHLTTSTKEVTAWLSSCLSPDMGVNLASVAELVLQRLALNSLDDLHASVDRLQERIDQISETDPIKPEIEFIKEEYELVWKGINDLIMGDTDVEIKWPVQFFYDGNNFAGPAPLIMNMVGPARCLYYGPFLHLPEGEWLGEICLGLSDDARDTQLRVEVYTDRPQTSFIANANRGGVYSLPIEFEINDSRQPVQLRLFINRGEIEGRIGLAYATVKPKKLMSFPVG